MKVLIDENLPQRWCEFLSANGFTAHHWLEVGDAGSPDEQVFRHAQLHQMVILTQDLDFTRLLALGKARLPSVIQLRVDCPIPPVVGEQVLQVLQTFRSRLLAGCLVTLDAKKCRVRILPLS